MAKQTGLGDQLFINGYDIGGDISAISTLSTPRETLPATGITKFAMERLFGKRDGNAEFTSYFNDATDQEHDALKGLPRTDVHLMYLRGTSLGGSSVGMIGKQLNYDPSRGDDGALTFGVNAQANAFGIDWLTQLTAGKRTDTAATNGTGVDFGAASAFGFQAYLQVFSFTGTSVTVKLQESSDNGAGDAWTDVSGGGFTAATGRTAQRIQSVSDTLAVERYLRVVTTGTFSSAVFAVGVCRNEALRVI
ncbi:MAG TPA: hypothetical protein VJQ57_13755 [Acidimicrobiia bacterium]|nr:hypothetical protein [Acidimicrobiia bacterium]